MRKSRGKHRVMANFIRDEEVDASVLKGKLIAIIGYGSQGSAQANCLRDSGMNVIVGLREYRDGKTNGKISASWQKAKADGFTVLPIAKASEKADIIHMLLPDEVQPGIYEKEIKQSMKKGKVLCFSHGFNICFKRIAPPKEADVIMVSPHAPGAEVRKQYINGSGVPALIAVHRDASGNARAVALAMAKALHWTKAGVIECSFNEETYEDLFAEQSVLCGGLIQLIKNAFEVLVEAGYPPKIAYLSCIHELKPIVDLIHQGGIADLAKAISNTAEYGMWSVGPKIIGREVKERMKECLKRVEKGDFAKTWVNEYKKGMPFLKKSREEISKHPIEVVGNDIRSLFKRKDDNS